MTTTTLNSNTDVLLDSAVQEADTSIGLHQRNVTRAEAIQIVQNTPAAELENVKPLAFAFGSDPRVNLNDPNALVDPCIEVTPIVNPLMDAILIAQGMERIGPRTYAMGVGEDASPTAMIKILKALPSHLCEISKKAERAAGSGLENNYGYYSISSLIGQTPLGRTLNYAELNRTISGNREYRTIQAGDNDIDRRYHENCLIAISTNQTQLYIKFVTGFTKRRYFETETKTRQTTRWNHNRRGYEQIEEEYEAPVICKGFHFWKGSPDFNLLKFKQVKDPVRLTPAEAFAVMKQAKLFGYPIQGEETFQTLRGEIPGKIIAKRIPGSPGMGELIIGKNLLSRIPDTALKGAIRKFQAPEDNGHNQAPYKVAVLPATKINEIVDRIKQSRRARIGEDDIITDDYLGDIVSMASPDSREFDELRPYQNEMVNLHLATKIGAVNACSPGTGKTPTTLTGFRAKAQAKKGWRGIAVVPASVRSQWLEEAENWFAKFLPNAKIRNFTPAQLRKDYSSWLLEAGDDPALVVLSYQQAAKGLDQLVMYDYDDIVCDEAAILSNKSSARTKALWILRDCCETAIATTGTPIGSSLDSLGAIVAWTRNERDAFDADHRLSKRFDMTKEGDDKALVEALGPVLFRRDASVIRDQMPHIENSVIILDPHSSEKKLADGARDELKSIIELMAEREEFIAELQPQSEAHLRAQDELRKVRGALLGGVTIARKAASDPAALEDSDAAAVKILKSSGLLDRAMKNGGTKRKYVKDLTVDLVGNGEAVLIFSDFSTVAQRIADELRSEGIKVGTWFGGNTKQREQDKAAFMNGELDVMVLTGAGREGLNLQRASALIHYDLPWVPTQVIQRVGRAARFGSTADRLKVITPVMRGTIEERVASVLVPRAVEALIALDRHRGVKGSDTDIGQAIGGLNDAVSDEVKQKSERSGLLDLANEVLA